MNIFLFLGDVLESSLGNSMLIPTTEDTGQGQNLKDLILNYKHFKEFF